MSTRLQRKRRIAARAPVLSLALALFVASAACAQEAHEAREPSVIRAGAQATVSRAPDEALLIVGVQTEATRSERAAAENAEKLAAVLEALRGVAGEDAKLRTSGYTLSPRYDYRKDAPREVVGYTASNAVEVRTPELAAVGRLIEAATSAGANDVRGLQFRLADDLEAQAAALSEATRRARVRAEAIAAALGVELGRVLSASDSGAVGPPQPRFERSMAMADRQRTPIEPGQLEVRASVTLSFEVAR